MKVKKTTQGFLMHRWLPVWVILVVILLAVLTIWTRLLIIRTTYSMNEVDKMIQQLHDTREQAELRVTALRSPRRLELLARSRFNLTQPRSEQVIHLPDSDLETHVDTQGSAQK